MYNILYKSEDIMKVTKDVVNIQLSTSAKLNLLAPIVRSGASHVAISVPLDMNAQMIAAGTTPASKTIEAETQEWCDLIHSFGMKVIHRGTFSGTEAIWGFPYYVFGSGNQLDIGDHTTAATDGESTFCGRVLRYITTNVGASHWIDGDIFAPIPEPTTRAFDGNAWWDPSNSTVNFAAAFAEFKAVSDAAFQDMAKNVKFQTHNNYSEARSGWIPNSMFTSQAIVAVDYYGQYQGTFYNRVLDYIDDISWLRINKGVPVFWSEFGDLPNALPSTIGTIDQRLNFLILLYLHISQFLVDTGKLVGFNYWGGWPGQNTSILLVDGSGNYHLNARGKILAHFYTNHSGLIRVPVITAGSSDDTYTF